ncbi:MAG TPA: outer membrane lipoprotein-sorting protein [Polyangia bacterium]|nr:outer membrane lipoprotein-sorting protein [Polyangia bacterium]
MSIRNARVRAAAGLLWLITLAARSAAAAPPTAREIVEAADRARNPQEPFRSTLTLVTYRNGQARERVVLGLHAKPEGHQFKNLVRYVDPPRDAGKLVLLDASKMWFYDPASKTSVRISAQQRLVGQASDGDVLTVNLAHDYTATLIGEETIKDADHQDRRAWHLNLVAATGDAVYARLEYWVERDSYRAIKGKFYSDSGRLLKMAYYRKFAEVMGVVRPTETVIIDAVDANLVTTVDGAGYRAQELPDAWFQRDYLPHFEED